MKSNPIISHPYWIEGADKLLALMCDGYSTEHAQEVVKKIIQDYDNRKLIEESAFLKLLLDSLQCIEVSMMLDQDDDINPSEQNT